MDKSPQNQKHEPHSYDANDTSRRHCFAAKAKQNAMQQTETKTTQHRQIARREQHHPTPKPKWCYDNGCFQSQ